MAKPLVNEAIDQDSHLTKGLQMLFYSAALPLSRQTLDYTAGIIRRHRRLIGSPWRKLNARQQALLVLAYLRKGETFAELAAGFGISTATAWGYVTETTALLAGRSPKLRQAPRAASKGRARVPGHRRHLDSYRPGRRGPVLLLRQAPSAWDEPAGHRQSRRRDRVGVRAAARRGA
jgi:hypothetical protein